MTRWDQNVTFEARELKPYAEPVSKSDLTEGAVYFALQFADEKLLVPYLQPFVFIGKNLEKEDVDLYYFQKIESHLAGVRYGSAAEEDWPDFEAYGPDQGKHIFEYERALDRLLVCSLRRREYLGPPDKGREPRIQ
ncbi:MAG TPA: hypothetical protein VMD77_12095 [Candidatus Baltobacteraceae bacterium]|nr:hypothetical protein [Candidatus Baltobacteraceae bacterium]